VDKFTTRGAISSGLAIESRIPIECSRPAERIAPTKGRDCQRRRLLITVSG